MKYLDLAIANEQIGTIDIKGKDYAEVNQRIKAFRMVYPQGFIKTTLIGNKDGVCIFEAKVGYYNDAVYENKRFKEEIVLGEGTAYEKEDSSFINKTSYIENCETSAVGRALGMAGFGIDVSVASAEEVQNAINNQVVTQEEADNYTLTFGKHKGKKLTEVPAEYVEWLMGNTQDERMLKIIELATGLVPPTQEDVELMAEFNRKLIESESDLDKVLETCGVSSVNELTTEQLKKVISIFDRKLNK